MWELILKILMALTGPVLSALEDHAFRGSRLSQLQADTSFRSVLSSRMLQD